MLQHYPWWFDHLSRLDNSARRAIRSALGVLLGGRRRLGRLLLGLELLLGALELLERILPVLVLKDAEVVEALERPFRPGGELIDEEASSSENGRASKDDS